MELVITPKGIDADRETLALAGSIDLVTRGALVSAGQAILAAGHDLALDMSEVDFMDSTGIGALVELHNVAKSHGVVLVIPQRSARVERILEVTGLADSWVA